MLNLISQISDVKQKNHQFLRDLSTRISKVETRSKENIFPIIPDKRQVGLPADCEKVSDPAKMLKQPYTSNLSTLATR